MNKKRNIVPGILISVLLAILALSVTNVIGKGYIGTSVIAMLIGMLLNPLVSKYSLFN